MVAFPTSLISRESFSTSFILRELGLGLWEHMWLEDKYKVFTFGFRNGRFWFSSKINDLFFCENKRYISVHKIAMNRVMDSWRMSYHSIFEITNHNLEETLRIIHVVPIMMCNARFEHCPRFVHPTTSPTM